MSKVTATITTSVDGYIVGPDDHEGQGLGVGGERLHYWVMGGPWTYETDDREPGAGMGEQDQAFFDDLTADLGAGVCGRGMYDSSGAWGGRTRSTARSSSSPTGSTTSPTPRPGSRSSAASRRQSQPPRPRRRGQGRRGQRRRRRDPSGPARRPRRRARDLGRPRRARRRQAALRGLRPRPRPAIVKVYPAAYAVHTRYDDRALTLVAGTSALLQTDGLGQLLLGLLELGVVAPLGLHQRGQPSGDHVELLVRPTPATGGRRSPAAPAAAARSRWRSCG